MQVDVNNLLCLPLQGHFQRIYFVQKGRYANHSHLNFLMDVVKALISGNIDKRGLPKGEDILTI